MGWLFLIVAWGFIFSITIFCFWRIFKQNHKK